MFCDISCSEASRKEAHIFCDASKEAIGAVAYLKIFDVNRDSSVYFLLGKAKVAPSHGHTIPRLELCSAVVAVELADTIRDQLNVDLDDVKFYSDSRVVLGYIHNEKRRFYVYVGNRVSRIRVSSSPDQWSYVPSELNPADHATRCIPASELRDSAWIRGPQFLVNDEQDPTEPYTLVNPESDQEVRPDVTSMKTDVAYSSRKLGTERFSRFSSWRKLVVAIAVLKCAIETFKSRSVSSGQHPTESLNKSVESRTEAERFIVREVQEEVFGPEISALKDGRQIPRRSSLLQLSPFLDAHGILRVGGRLKHAKDSQVVSDSLRNPVIIPKGHHIASLLVRHFHEKVSHQGRHFTEGAIRSAGFWIVGARRIISSMIQRCVTCNRLRGKFCCQKMADLPPDRVNPSPPFTFVGIDTFGPWPVVARRTRGGQSNQKRWAVLFTCLVSRAIHIEVVEELSSSSFINALRRFLSIRGPVQQFRSDRGTNFVGATEDLSINALFVEDGPVRKFLNDSGIDWLFNPPHSSHMGGAWERMIGVSRRILDSMLLRTGMKNLTHEVLTTLMAEVCAIVNARPIVSVSSDPEDPEVLTPATLLTQKTAQKFHDFPNFNIKEMYKAQWKHVQVLAQEFWDRWRRDYLSTLQSRRKWSTDQPNLKEGDVVLLKDHECARNFWPLGLVLRTFPSDDDKVRKVEVRVSRDGKPVTYIRPVTELVNLHVCE